MTHQTRKCRHNRTWIIAGGYLEWCYECGALRQLDFFPSANASAPRSYWVRPVGDGGTNPAMKHDDGFKELPRAAERWRRKFNTLNKGD